MTETHATKVRQRRIIIDGVIFQLQAQRPLGISRIWKGLLPELINALPDHSIIMLQRSGYPSGIAGINELAIPPYYGYMQTSGMDADDTMLSQVCKNLGADIFLSTYYTYAPGIKNMLLMYDMIPEVMGFDLSQSEWVSKKRAIARANSFVAISHSTKNDLIKFYSVSPEKISVAHCGVSPEFHPAPYDEIISFNNTHGLKVPYFLLSGNRGLYKNSTAFLQALAGMPLREECEVVSLGGESQPLPEEQQWLSKVKMRFIPWQDVKGLRAAYSGALALIYLSRYEGFGLPVAEAMACGCPVITTRLSSLPEVGGEAVLYADPDSAEDITVALNKVVNSITLTQLVHAGIERAHTFTWRSMAENMAQVILFENKQGYSLFESVATKEPLQSQTEKDHAELLFISPDVQISEGLEADSLLREKNDLRFYSPKDGIIVVDRARWEEAQAYEERTWLVLNRSTDDDRNVYHSQQFNFYSSIKGKTFENVIELGSGPFTNLRLILEHIRAKNIYLLDPLAERYLDHPHCTYKYRQLRDQPVQLINSSIEDFNPPVQFDLVVMINVLEHCFHVPTIIRKVLGMLSPGGIFIFHDKLYTHQSIVPEKRYDAGHPLRVRGEIIMQFLKQNFITLYEHSAYDSSNDVPMIYFIGEQQPLEIIHKDIAIPIIPGKQNLQIIIAYRGIPHAPEWATGDSLARAFRRLGHRVSEYGNYYQTAQKLNQEALPEKADLLVYCECNDSDPQYTELKKLHAQTKVYWDFDTENHPQFSMDFIQDMQFDIVFFANKNFADQFNQINPRAIFLPYAFDDEHFFPITTKPKTTDVALIGSSFPERLAFIEKLQQAGLQVKIFSGKYMEKYVEAINDLKIHLNYYPSGGRGLLVARVWETIGCGTLLLTERADFIEDFFTDGEHVVLFETVEDCKEKLRYLLTHDTEREQIARQGWLHGLQFHTYVSRAQEIIDVIDRTQ
jgi:glycosyltransferase involved in cell wall biosynthesis/SAM-dependent methyltransferase